MKGDDAQVYYLQKVEEINPNIRYCNYILGDETAKKDLMNMKLKSGTGSELAEKIDVNIYLNFFEKIQLFWNKWALHFMNNYC